MHAYGLDRQSLRLGVVRERERKRAIRRWRCNIGACVSLLEEGEWNEARIAVSRVYRADGRTVRARVEDARRVDAVGRICE